MLELINIQDNIITNVNKTTGMRMKEISLKMNDNNSKTYPRFFFLL